MIDELEFEELMKEIREDYELSEADRYASMLGLSLRVLEESGYDNGVQVFKEFRKELNMDTLVSVDDIISNM